MSVLAMDDDRLYDALRAGDEEAFTALVDRYHSSLVRLAMAYVRNLAAAEEVVQETWLGVVRGLARFERRSSLKTWIFRILVNRAKTHARRDGRAIPFSALEPPARRQSIRNASSTGAGDYLRAPGARSRRTACLPARRVP